MFTRSVTPDQINTDALLASRDYFGTASDFGVTASSADAAAPRIRSTLSPQGTGDSVQYRTDEGGSTGGWPAGLASRESGRFVDQPGDDDLGATYEVPAVRASSLRVIPEPITMPRIDDYNEDGSGSDDEVSELSNEQ